MTEILNIEFVGLFLMKEILNLEFISLFITLAGFIIGLGAVTVIDLHGFLGRKSSYWTEATTRTHKVTKPLIWAGTTMAGLGLALMYLNAGIVITAYWHLFIFVVLILNGCFLSFSVSPFLLKREKLGQEKEILPNKWQRYITVSFIISFTGWWSALGLLVYHILYLR